MGGVICCASGVGQITLDNPLTEAKMEIREMVHRETLPIFDGSIASVANVSILQWNVLASGLAWKTCTGVMDRRCLLWQHRQKLFR